MKNAVALAVGWTVAWTAASMAWAACSAAGPAAPGTIALGRDFSLRAGAAALTSDGSLRVGFDGVTSDSRCARGEQCVWAGDATVQVWLQLGSGAKVGRQLHTTPQARQTVRALCHALRLVRLDPTPVAGTVIAPADYTVTLSLVRDATAEADR